MFMVFLSLNMTVIIFVDEGVGRSFGSLRNQRAALTGLSCWRISASRAAASTARPSSLSPRARASCSVPTRVRADHGCAVDARARRAGSSRTRDRGADARGRGLPDGERLPRHVAAQRRHGAPRLARREMTVGQISFDQRTECAHALAAARFRRPGDDGRALAAGAAERLDEQRVARGEVRVEAAVREPGFLHHLGHADACVTVAPDRPRGHLDDVVVRLFLAAVRGAAHRVISI